MFLIKKLYIVSTGCFAHKTK